MNAYKKLITIEDPNNVVLSSLPFQPGQRVEITISVEENSRAEISQKFRSLFDKTQEIPEVQEITEEEIAAEIDAYRIKIVSWEQKVSSGGFIDPLCHPEDMKACYTWNVSR